MESREETADESDTPARYLICPYRKRNASLSLLLVQTVHKGVLLNLKVKPQIIDQERCLGLSGQTLDVSDKET